MNTQIHTTILYTIRLLDDIVDTIRARSIVMNLLNYIDDIIESTGYRN